MSFVRSLTRGVAAVAVVAGFGLPAHAQIDLPDIPDLPTLDTVTPADARPEAGTPEPSGFRLPFLFKAGTIASLSGYRDPAVSPGSSGPDWSQRFDIRMLGHSSLTDRVGLLTNLRFRTQIADDRDYDFTEDSNLDVQELALDVRMTDWLTLEAGRINVRNGVATGFNPTDWFKADSLVVADSFDIADRREDRLGTLVLQGVWHDENAVVVTGFRPAVSEEENRVLSDRDLIGLGLDRTNGEEAFYVKVSPLFSNNLAVTLNAFHEPGQPGLGAEISGAVSETVVVFAEWFAQRRYGFVDETRLSVPLPDDVAERLGATGDRRILHQAAVGATWSLPFELVEDEDIALTAEFHFNQAGLSRSETEAWFDAGLSGAADDRALWAIRGTAARRQEPLSEYQLFFRFAWGDMFDNVDFNAISFVVPQDPSALVQAELDFLLLENTQLSLTAYAAMGGNETIFGSQVSNLGCRASLVFSF